MTESRLLQQKSAILIHPGGRCIAFAAASANAIKAACRILDGGGSMSSESHLALSNFGKHRIAQYRAGACGCGHMAIPTHKRPRPPSRAEAFVAKPATMAKMEGAEVIGHLTSLG